MVKKVPELSAHRDHVRERSRLVTSAGGVETNDPPVRVTQTQVVVSQVGGGGVCGAATLPQGPFSSQAWLDIEFTPCGEEVTELFTQPLISMVNTVAFHGGQLVFGDCDRLAVGGDDLLMGVTGCQMLAGTLCQLWR